MPFFFALAARSRESTLAVFAAAAEAAERRESEYGAALVIQAWFRATVVRARVSRWHAAALKIQRTYRGHCGRRVARERRAAAEASDRRALFDAAATAVQKTFRGFYSRKYVHNYAARKAYLAAVVEKSERTLAQVEAEAQRVREEQARIEHEQQVAQFEKLAAGLHHLSSTSAVRGVYNSAQYGDTQPTVFDEPMEAHLRKAAKKAIRSQSAPVKKKKKASAAAPHKHAETTTFGVGAIKPRNDGKGVRFPLIKGAWTDKNKPLGPFLPQEQLQKKVARPDRRSLLASSPYDVVERARREDERESRVRFIDRKGFRTTFPAASRPEPVSSVHCGTDFGTNVTFRESKKDGFVGPRSFISTVQSDAGFGDDL